MALQRSLWLGAGLVLSLLATWYAAGVDDTDDDLLAEPQRSAPAARLPLSGQTAPPAMPLRANAAPGAGASRESGAQRMTREGGDLFASRSWKPAPPPPPPPPPRAVAAPAPPPRAPALPFRYLGRMEEDGRVIAFLAEGAQPMPRVVRQGDLLPNYRVDEITSAGMRLTYLPLNETQRLLFGSFP